MATRKHAKHATTAATSRPATGSSTTDTPTTTTATSAPTTRSSRSRTPTTNAQADLTTTTNTTTASSRPPAPPRPSTENASRTQPPTVAVTSKQRPADGDATTSTGRKSTDSTDSADKKVIVITNKSEFDKNLEEAGNKLVLVEFFASWCGPCRLLSPKLEQLAIDYEDKVFVMKMDVDECEEVPMEYGISSMPTFLFMRNKKKIELFVGSNSEKLINRLERLCDPTKTLTSVPSNISTRPSASGEQSASNLKSTGSKRKLREAKGNEAEQSAAPSTATTSTPTSSSGKKTAAK